MRIEFLTLARCASENLGGLETKARELGEKLEDMIAGESQPTQSTQPTQQQRQLKARTPSA